MDRSRSGNRSSPQFSRDNGLHFHMVSSLSRYRILYEVFVRILQNEDWFFSLSGQVLLRTANES
jgi:hypothetical protein